MKKLMFTTIALILAVFLLGSTPVDAQERRGHRPAGKPQLRERNGGRSQERVREFKGRRSRTVQGAQRLQRFKENHPEAAKRIKQRMEARRDRIRNWTQEHPEAAEKIKKQRKGKGAGRREKPKNMNDKEKRRPSARTRSQEQTLERIESLEKRIQALKRRMAR